MAEFWGWFIDGFNHSFEGYRITTWFSWITGIINRNPGYFQKCEIFDFWPFFGGRFQWNGLLSAAEVMASLHCLSCWMELRKARNFRIAYGSWTSIRQREQIVSRTSVKIGCQHMSTPDETKLGIRFQYWNLSVISVIYVATWKPELLAALNPWLINIHLPMRHPE